MLEGKKRRRGDERRMSRKSMIARKRRSSRMVELLRGSFLLVEVSDITQHTPEDEGS